MSQSPPKIPKLQNLFKIFKKDKDKEARKGHKKHQRHQLENPPPLDPYQEDLTNQNEYFNNHSLKIMQQDLKKASARNDGSRAHQQAPLVPNLSSNYDLNLPSSHSSG